jgi:hypothetical protein
MNPIAYGAGFIHDTVKSRIVKATIGDYASRAALTAATKQQKDLDEKKRREFAEKAVACLKFDEDEPLCGRRSDR